MKMRSPASSEMPHADIAAKIDYRDMWEDQIHDVLAGYVDVPTHPDPVRLRLTKAEVAHRWHMIQCERLTAVKDGGDAAAITTAMAAVEWAGAMAAFEAMKEAIGDLSDGRFLTYTDQKVRHGIYSINDGDGIPIMTVVADDRAVDVHRLLGAYDAGVARGGRDAQAAIRAALGTV